MASLKQLLDELEIDTTVKDEQDLKDVKIDDIPEEHRPIFKKAVDIINAQTNELAKRELVIKTLKETKQEPIIKKEEQEESVFGLEPTDPYAKVFKSLSDEIKSLKSEKVTNTQEVFKNNIITFVKENPDTVQYVKEMDAILVEHPTMGKDIPTLYKMAKDLKERRATLQKNKKDELAREEKAGNFKLESGGPAPHNVREIKEAKSITQAFDFAEKSLSRR